MNSSQSPASAVNTITGRKDKKEIIGKTPPLGIMGPQMLEQIPLDLTHK